MTNDKILASSPYINGMAPHLLIKKEDIGDIVLLPGDPGRVDKFKDILTDFKILSFNREYKVGVGYYNGVKITVCSTGIGAPSCEIAVVELIELGAKVLIRIGGTGSLKKGINLGDMIINTGALRRGGATNFYVPSEYPAIASYEVVKELIESCKKHNTTYWTGISASVGSFFAGQARPVMNKKFYDDNYIDKLVDMNIINMEMESETIMTLGSLFNVYTGSICAVHASRTSDEWLVDFESAQINMIRIALDACVNLSKVIK